MRRRLLPPAVSWTTFTWAWRLPSKRPQHPSRSRQGASLSFRMLSGQIRGSVRWSGQGLGHPQGISQCTDLLTEFKQGRAKILKAASDAQSVRRFDLHPGLVIDEDVGKLLVVCVWGLSPPCDLQGGPPHQTEDSGRATSETEAAAAAAERAGPFQLHSGFHSDCGAAPASRAPTRRRWPAWKRAGAAPPPCEAAHHHLRLNACQGPPRSFRQSLRPVGAPLTLAAQPEGFAHECD